MSFTRKELKELGLDEETREKLIDMHLSSVTALREQLEKAKADEGGAWKQKYQALVDKQAAEKARAAKEAAARAWLKENGLVRENLARLLLEGVDLDALEVDEGGGLKDAKSLEGLKADFGELFAREQTRGADKLTPPPGGGRSYKTRDEIMAIQDRAERRAQIAQHPGLFGLSSEA